MFLLSAFVIQSFPCNFFQELVPKIIRDSVSTVCEAQQDVSHYVDPITRSFGLDLCTWEMYSYDTETEYYEYFEAELHYSDGSVQTSWHKQGFDMNWIERKRYQRYFDLDGNLNGADPVILDHYCVWLARRATKPLDQVKSCSIKAYYATGKSHFDEGAGFWDHANQGVVERSTGEEIHRVKFI
jgi:hypothetical protein